MNASRACHSLIDVLIDDFVREHTAPRRRLPLGRCACHEPSVKWCGRHGQPLKRALSLSGPAAPRAVPSRKPAA
jgi:hypothetical protein